MFEKSVCQLYKLVNNNINKDSKPCNKFIVTQYRYM